MDTDDDGSSLPAQETRYSEGRLHPIPADLVATIRSGVTISTITQCVDQLVMNSLDAGASRIFVSVDLKEFTVRVKDDGTGVKECDLERIGQRHMTSKCNSLKTLRNFGFYGFRGEALASILEMSGSVNMRSRSRDERCCFMKRFIAGKSLGPVVKEAESKRTMPGFSITINDFMGRFPVRQKRIDRPITIEDIKASLEQLLVANHTVTLHLKDEATQASILDVKGTESLEKTFLQINTELKGNPVHQNMEEVFFNFGVYFYKCFISKGFHRNSWSQLVYVNKRFITRCKIHRRISEAITQLSDPRKFPGGPKKASAAAGSSKSRSSAREYPVFVLEIISPILDCEITSDPSKTTVQFKSWETVMTGLEGMIEQYKCALERQLAAEIFAGRKKTKVIKSFERDVEFREQVKDVGKDISTHVLKRAVHSRVAFRGRPEDEPSDSESEEESKLKATKADKKRKPAESKARCSDSDSSGKGYKDVFQHKKKSAQEKLKLTTASKKPTFFGKSSLKRKSEADLSAVAFPKKPSLLATATKADSQPQLLKRISDKFSPWKNKATMAKTTAHEANIVHQSRRVLKPVKRKAPDEEVTDVLSRMSVSLSASDSDEGSEFQIKQRKMSRKSHKNSDCYPEETLDISKSKTISNTNIFGPKRAAREWTGGNELDGVPDNKYKRYSSGAEDNSPTSIGEIISSESESDDSENGVTNSNIYRELYRQADHSASSSPEGVRVTSDRTDMISDGIQYTLSSSQEVVEELEQIGLVNNVNSPTVPCRTPLKLTIDNNASHQQTYNNQLTYLDSTSTNSPLALAQPIPLTVRNNLSQTLGASYEPYRSTLFGTDCCGFQEERKELNQVQQIIHIPEVDNHQEHHPHPLDELENPWSDFDVQVVLDAADKEWLRMTNSDGSIVFINLSTAEARPRICQVRGTEKLTTAQSELLNRNFRYSWLSRHFPKSSNQIWRPDEDKRISKDGNMDIANCGNTILGPAVVHCMQGELVGEELSKWKDGQGYSAADRPDTSTGLGNVRVSEYWERPTLTNEMPLQCLNSLEVNFCKTDLDKHMCRFRKEDLGHIHVMCQLDQKFIVAKVDLNYYCQTPSRRYLVLFDQHAVHERIRLERFLNSTCKEENGEKWVVSQALMKPIILHFGETEIRIMRSYPKEFKSLGVKMDFLGGGAISVSEVPKCFIDRELAVVLSPGAQRGDLLTSLLHKYLLEHVHHLLGTSGSVMTGAWNVPKTVFNLLCSKACHGAIKFGDSLDHDTCVKLMEDLKNCKVPFQCAHGRPVLFPIMELPM